MVKIIQSLHARGLHCTATNLEKETSEIDYAVIARNARKITAFANRLSSSPDVPSQKHAKVLLSLVDDAQAMSQPKA